MIKRSDLATIWLLGDPVAHSLSPLIQNAALQELGEKAVYLAARVVAEDFLGVVEALPKMGALGANVTVPHKVLALQACHALSPRAAAIGAVNTLRFSAEGTLGDNTDGVGWWRSLTEARRGRDFERALVIGAGGASRAVCHTLLEQGLPTLCLFNRTVEKAEELAEALRQNHPAARIECRSLSAFAGEIVEKCLVVQTTSVGLHGEGPPVELSDTLPAGVLLSELIYGRVTPLMKAWREHGGEAVDGLGMLVGQAAEALAMWLQRPPADIPYEIMLGAARKRLSDKGGQ